MFLIFVLIPLTIQLVNFNCGCIVNNVVDLLLFISLSTKFYRNNNICEVIKCDAIKNSIVYLSLNNV